MREEEKLLGSRFAACMWIYTEVVLSNGQEVTQEYLRRRVLSIMESFFGLRRWLGAPRVSV